MWSTPSASSAPFSWPGALPRSWRSLWSTPITPCTRTTPTISPPASAGGRCAVAALSRWVGNQTDCMIAPTGKVRRLLQGYGVRCPVFVAPTGIDLRRFRGETDPIRRAVMRSSLGIPAEEYGAGVRGPAGGGEEHPGAAEVPGIPGQPPRDACCWWGTGPDRSRLEQVARDLRQTSPAVIFAGMVPPEEVPDWYRLGDLFVSASSSETQGLTYIEALAAGVPALCRADPCLEGVIRDGGKTAGSIAPARSSASGWRSSWPVRRITRPCAAGRRRARRPSPPNGSPSGWRGIYLERMRPQGGTRRPERQRVRPDALRPRMNSIK